jgi:hypothetical protein
MIDLVYANLAILSEPKTRLELWHKYTGIYYDNHKKTMGCGAPDKLYAFVKRTLPEYYNTLDSENRPMHRVWFVPIFCHCCAISLDDNLDYRVLLPVGDEVICPECGQRYRKIVYPGGANVNRDLFDEVMEHNPDHDLAWLLYQAFLYREVHYTPNFSKQYFYDWMAENWEKTE